MPELSAEDLVKLSMLEQRAELARQKLAPALRFTELVCIYWPLPDGAKWYAFTQIDQTRGFEGIASFADVRAKIISSTGSPFLDLPQSAAISDDSADLNFSDIDGVMSALCYRYGQGVRVEVFHYYADVDLRLSVFVGNLRAPKDANGITLKVQASAGFRSAKILTPRRLPTPGCSFIFGALLPTLQAVAEQKSCPYNAHLGGDVGVPGFTDCPRDSVTSCAARLVTKNFFPGFTTIVETVNNFQTKGSNLPATARGNENSLTEAIRAVYGHRLLKALRLLAFRPENDANHPDKGFVAALFEVGEGPFLSIDSFNMNNVPVGFEHQQIRLGTIGQAPTGFSPNINPYSATGIVYGRIQGDYRNVTAGGLSATVHARGFSNVRVYSDANTYTEQYTTNPAWVLLDMLCNKRWGYGDDYSRYEIQSFIDVAAWCDEIVSVTDPNGNVFSGTRATCNIELTSRAIHDQVEDFCTMYRISPPFEHNGLKMIVPLRRETIDDSIPFFTDYGPEVNICADNKNQPILKWSYVGDDELSNQYTVTFDNIDNGFTSTPLIFGNQRQQLAAGKAYGDTAQRVVNKNISAAGITSMQEAARLGNSLLALGPLDRGGIVNNFSVTFTTWFTQVFNVRMYSLVKLRLRALQQVFDLLGIEGFQYFRVMSRKRKGNLQVELTVQAYPVEFYENMETVIEVPPQPIEPNPGGGPGNRPCSVGFQSLGHTDRTIEIALQEC